MNYERIAGGLQKRLAETVSRYEGDLALLQEQATQAIEERDAKIAELEEQLADKAAEVVPASKK
jgi:hypothetical protein